MWNNVVENPQNIFSYKKNIKKKEKIGYKKPDGGKQNE